jgi:hypothetical protein
MSKDDNKPVETDNTPRSENLDNAHPNIDIKVIGSDTEKGEELEATLNWVVKEYTGVEISAAPEGMTAEELIEAGKFPDDFALGPIQGIPVEVGQVIVCPGLTGGIHIGTVAQTDKGDWCFTTPSGMFGALEYGIDDRGSWTCVGLANLKGIMKLNLERNMPEQEKLERAIRNAHRVTESRKENEEEGYDDAVDVARWLEQLHALRFPPEEEEQAVIDLDDHRVRSEREFEGEQMLYIEALFGKETFAYDVAIRDIEAMKQGREDPSKPLRPPATDYECELTIKHIRWLANEFARLSKNEDWVRPEDDDAIGR